MMLRLTKGDIAFAALLLWTGFATVVAWRANALPGQRPAVRTARYVASWKDYQSRGFVRGPNSAPWTLVVFSDFQCPYCRRFAPVLDSIHLAHPDVRIVERHFPILELHPESYNAALFAECARDQGLYESARNALFANSGLVESRSWQQLAVAAGIPDVDRSARCVATAADSARVQADMRAGLSLGVLGTPSVLLNDSLLGHTPTYAELDSILRPRAGAR